MQQSHFHIDSYEILKNWFKYRHGRALENEDIQSYQRIVTTLKDIGKLAEEIKTLLQYNQLKKLEIFEKVSVVVTEKLKIEPEKVTNKANFVADLGADPLDMIEIFLALEEIFELKISVQTTETLMTVQQLIDYISQYNLVEPGRLEKLM